MQRRGEPRGVEGGIVSNNQGGGLFNKSNPGESAGVGGRNFR